MSIIVYAVGRPGSGKSTAVRLMKRLAKKHGYRTLHVRDYVLLLAMTEEPEYKAKFRTNARGGFDILDPAMYDVALKRLLRQIKHLRTDKYDIIFVEFARTRYEGSFTELMLELRTEDYILCVEADLATCIERVDKRTTGSCGPDQHFVSEEIMRKYYSENNLPYINANFAQQFGLPIDHIEAIYNEGTIEELETTAKKYANVIFESIKRRRWAAIATKAARKLRFQHAGNARRRTVLHHNGMKAQNVPTIESSKSQPPSEKDEVPLSSKQLEIAYS